MDYATVQFTRQATTVVITLNRPQKLNAINWQIGSELLDIFNNHLGDARALIITGSAKAFCAGYDLSQTAEDVARGSSILEAYDQLAALTLPTIAAIEGFCLGGGLELALCCDLRFASETAQLGTPEVLRGIFPGGGGTQRLVRLIGPSRAKELMFSGDRISAGTAERWGLINRVCTQGEALNESLQYAARFVERAPLSIQEIKYLVDNAAHLALTDALNVEREHGKWVSQTEDAREGIQAFLEKRKPNFQKK